MLRLVLFLSLCPSAIAAEPVVTMSAVRVSPSDVSIRVHLGEGETIDEILVTAIRPTSSADQLGIRAGDHLLADSDGPVAGRKLNTIQGPEGFRFKGQVTFEGHRGLLRKKWSITVQMESLVKKKKTNQAPAATATTPSGAPEAPSHRKLPHERIRVLPASGG